MEKRREIALVTGASSGIGRETAMRLAENGFEVIAAARRKERLTELSDKVQGIIPKQVDLSDTDDLERFCGEISDLKEPVSVLVNNAGYSVRGALEDVPMDAVRRIFEVNLFAMIRVTQACLPGMRRLRKGTILNLSSIAGKFTFPLSGVYASTKHAMEAITDALRVELVPFGIRVVAIRPGAIATEFNDAGNEITGDLMARTDPEYVPLYQAFGESMGKMFGSIQIPGPDIIADIILEAVSSANPKAVYSAGPLGEIFLQKRTDLDDDEFSRWMAGKTGLMDLK